MRPRVIINADDFGITRGVNRAISELAGAGVVTSVSVMTNMPAYEEVAGLGSGVGAGVHFNLTVGRPVCSPSEVPSLTDEDGRFLGLDGLLHRLRRGGISAVEAGMELDAQAGRLLGAGVFADHVDSHESIIKYPFFGRIIRRIAKRHGITAVRTYRPRAFDYSRLLSPRRLAISAYLELDRMLWKRSGFNVADRYDSLIRPGLDRKAAEARLREIFGRLPQGVLEIGVHPGYPDGHDSPLGGYVYERVAEIEALLGKEAGRCMAESGAELVRFADIAGRAAC